MSDKPISETVTLEFLRYRTPDGEPTCCVDFSRRDVCDFHAIGVFGMSDFCSIHGQRLERQEDVGYLIPTRNCPLWAKP